VAVLTDRTLTIRASVHDVQIGGSRFARAGGWRDFPFLGDWRATLIPSLSVPRFR
jgi:multidrug efflux pump